MEMVMSNFQRLLESPFHWVADFAGGLLKRSRGTQRRRRERMLRREYLNG
jgi:cell shape-determining protein MreC